MVPLLPVGITSSVCACILSYCLSFLLLLRKNFSIKGFFNFCVVEIPLMTPRKPGIGTGNQVSNYLSILRCKHLLTGVEGRNFNTYTHTVGSERCNIATVVNHSCAHTCVFLLWLSPTFFYTTFISNVSLFFLLVLREVKYWFLSSHSLRRKDKHEFMFCILHHFVDVSPGV